MTRRRGGGDETWSRLRDWTRGQKEAERLAAHILHIEGYMSVEPSHPLGGPDSIKDMICTREGKRWIGAVSFPRGQKSFSEIQKKFKHDLQGVFDNQADGIAFVTNQELTLSERKELENVAVEKEVDLFHLERITHILDRPTSYGVRLEFLDIEMTKEEQLSFWAETSKTIERLVNTLNEFAREQKSAESRRASAYVTPEEESAMPAAFVHKCSYCRYSFYVKGPVPRSSYGVTCPECGNIDTYEPFDENMEFVP